MIIKNQAAQGVYNLNTIKVFPNPANDHITINYGNFASMSGHTLKITNNLGQVVKSLDLGNAVEVKHLMNTSDLASGIYHVKTSIGDKSTTKKLIIQ